MSIQQALDEFETELLTDLFGGVSAEHMVLGKGVFRDFLGSSIFAKINVSDTVNSLIQKFEGLAKPRMTPDGKIKFMQLEAKPVELYRELKHSLFGTPAPAVVTSEPRKNLL